MIVQILLDKPHQHFTNLDTISGQVFLRAPSKGDVSSIVVKLEGESRTRLLAPVRPDRQDRQRPVLEVHKILYRTQVVFPQGQSQDDIAQARATYTLNAGQYSYPFSFKLPFNNACQPANSLATNIAFSGLAVEVARTPTHHVKQTLPPSLSGFPGEAEIRYFAKVTVNRPSFFKENPRAWVNFTFLPIEAPRPPQSDGEAYARRQHQFLEPRPSYDSGKRKQSFFESLKKSSPPATPTSPITPSLSSTPPASTVPPRFIVDARLPNPAILTCNQDIPLRVLVKNQSIRTKNVYLQMLQIELIGYTLVRAHEVSRTESNSWIICSFSNMAIPLGSPSDPVGTEVPINREYWEGNPIPNSVAPSFETCNLKRWYEIEVRVGIGYGTYEHGRDQLVVLPLRLPVKVYSGIKPPEALLEAMAAAPKLPPNKPNLSAGISKPDFSSSSQPAPFPQTPVSPAVAGSSAFPPQQGTHLPPQAAPGYEEPPPSYEDAIATDLPPVDGYRGEYRPPPQPEGEPTFSGDEKRRSAG